MPSLQKFLFFFAVMSTRLYGAGAMTFTYNAPESVLDARYAYHWEILRTALDKTAAKWGPYKMVAAETMTELRQTEELMRASGKLSVMYLDAGPEFEERLIPVRIPVDRGLVSYRIFLIHKDNKDLLKNVRNLSDLRRFSIGQGLGWGDVEILQASGLKVVTGSSYEGLFEMLANKRFDLFSRGAVEILQEYEDRKAALPDLAIEQRLLLYYPLPMYFWFPKTDEGKRMAERSREGMLRMIEDGTYEEIFQKYQGSKIEKLHLQDRLMIKIPNRGLPPETPFNDLRLWFKLGKP
jgi:hypothetical protein